MKSVDKLFIVDLGITNPYINLAIEEYIYNHYEKNTFVLILWQNRNSIVIGQNQSVYSQCNLPYVKSNDVLIVRRKSGGGAVYHDLGNLNYTFISSYYDGICICNMKKVCEALNLLGLKAEISGRNDIIVEGKKISGNAFYRDEEKICHHGTLLVDTDLTEMYKVLNISSEKWSDKGIDSVQSRTINIKDIDNSITVMSIKERLTDVLSSEMRNAQVFYYKNIFDFTPDIAEIQKLSQMYSSKDWIYEKKIDESMVVKQKFNWGSVEVHILLSDNIITECHIFSDALDASIIPKISLYLNSLPFDSASVKKIFDILFADKLSDDQKLIANDIRTLLLAEIAI